GPEKDEGSRRCLVTSVAFSRETVPPYHDTGSGPTQPHRFYCGIGLQARTMHVCIFEYAGLLVCDCNFLSESEPVILKACGGEEQPHWPLSLTFLPRPAPHSEP